MKIKLLTLVTLVTSLNTAYANCNPSIIDETKIRNLSKDTSTIKLLQEFGPGCLSGMTVMTYQYVSKDGKPIWFWLSNKPNAFDRLQESIEKGETFEVNITFATKTLEDGTQKIIYPVNEIGKNVNDLIYNTYFD